MVTRQRLFVRLQVLPLVNEKVPEPPIMAHVTVPVDS